jgi:predicted dehydrogenase
VKAVVIGAGAIAKEHLGALRAIDAVEIAGVCDLSPAMAEIAADRFHAARWDTDYRVLLEEEKPDVVHVTTPASTHVPIATDALRAGAHVLVEKPIAPALDDLRILREESEKAGRAVLESHNYLFNAPVRWIFDLIEAGRLGDVVHVDVRMCLDICGEGSRFADPNAPHPALDMPGGAIGDFLPHFAYLAQAFTGPHRAVQTIWSKRRDSPLRHDEFRAQIEGERATGSILFSSSAEPPEFVVSVLGTKMRTSVNLFEATSRTERLAGGPKPLLPLRNALSESLECVGGGVGSLWRKLSGRPVGYEGLWLMIARLYEAIAGGEAPPVSLDETEASMRLVHEMCAQEPCS